VLAAVQSGGSLATTHPGQQGVTACRTHHDHWEGAALPAAAATTANSAPFSAGAAAALDEQLARLCLPFLFKVMLGCDDTHDAFACSMLRIAFSAGAAAVLTGAAG
jgi:hypothetical protein